MPTNPLRGLSPHSVIGRMVVKECRIGLDDFTPVSNTMKALYFPPNSDSQSGAAAPFTLCLNGERIIDRMLKADPYLLERDAGGALLVRMADKIAQSLMKSGTPKAIAHTMALDIVSTLASRDFVDPPDEVCPANSAPHERFINVVIKPEGVVFEMTTTFCSTDPMDDPGAAPPTKKVATANLTECSGAHESSLDETAASTVIDTSLDETAASTVIATNEAAESARGVTLTMAVEWKVLVTPAYDAETGAGELSARCVDLRVLLSNDLGAKVVHEQAQSLGAPGGAWMWRWLSRFLESIANHFRVKRIAFEFSPEAQTLAPDAAPGPAPLGPTGLAEFKRTAASFSAHPRGPGWEREPTRYRLDDKTVLRDAVASKTPSLSRLRDAETKARLERFVTSGRAAGAQRYRDLTQSLEKERSVTYQDQTVAEPTCRYASLLLAQAGVAASRDQQATYEAHAVLEERVYHAVREQQTFVRVDGQDVMSYETPDMVNARNYVAALRNVELQTAVANEARENLDKAKWRVLWLGQSEKTLQGKCFEAETLLLKYQAALSECATALNFAEYLPPGDQLALVKAKLLEGFLAQIQSKVGHGKGLHDQLVRLMKHGPNVTRTLIGHDGPHFPSRDTEQVCIDIYTRKNINFPAIRVEPGTVAVTITSGCAALKPSEMVTFGHERLDGSKFAGSFNANSYWLLAPGAGVRLDLIKYDAKFERRKQPVSEAPRAEDVENAASESGAAPAGLKGLEPHELRAGLGLVAQAHAAAEADNDSERRAREALVERVYQAFEQKRCIVELDGMDQLKYGVGEEARWVRAYINAERELRSQAEKTEEAKREAEHPPFWVLTDEAKEELRRTYRAERHALAECQTTLNASLRALGIPLDLPSTQQTAQVKACLLNALFKRLSERLRDTPGAWAQLSALLLYGPGATHELIYGNDVVRLPDRDTAQIVIKIFTKESDKLPGIRVNAGEVAVAIHAPDERRAVKSDSKASDAKARQAPPTLFEATWLVSSEEGLKLNDVHYDGAQIKRGPHSGSKGGSTLKQANAAVSGTATALERDKQLKAFEQLGLTRGDENRRGLTAKMTINPHAALQEIEVSQSTYGYGALLVERASDKQGVKTSSLTETLWRQFVQPASDAVILLNDQDPLAGNDEDTKTLREYAQALDYQARVRAKTVSHPPTTKQGADEAQAIIDRCAPLYQMQKQSVDKQIARVKEKLYEKLAAHIGSAFPDQDVQKRIFGVLCHARGATGKVIHGNGGLLFAPTHARPGRITIDTSRDGQAGATANATITLDAHDERQHGEDQVIIGEGRLDASTIAMQRSRSAWRVSAQKTRLLHVEYRAQCVDRKVLDHRAWRALPDPGVDLKELWLTKPESGLDFTATERLSEKGDSTAQEKYTALLHRQVARWDEPRFDAQRCALGTAYLQTAATLDPSKPLDKARRTQLRRTLGRQLLLSCTRNQPLLRLNDVDLLAKRREVLADHYAKAQQKPQTIDYRAVRILAESFGVDTKLPTNLMMEQVGDCLINEVFKAIGEEVPDKRKCQRVFDTVVNAADAMHVVIRDMGSLDWEDPDRGQTSILICTRPNADLTQPLEGAQHAKVNVKVPEGDVVIRITETSRPLGAAGRVQVGGKGATVRFSLRHFDIADMESICDIRIHDDGVAMEGGSFRAEIRLTRGSAEALKPSYVPESGLQVKAMLERKRREAEEALEARRVLLERPDLMASLEGEPLSPTSDVTGLDAVRVDANTTEITKLTKMLDTQPWSEASTRRGTVVFDDEEAQ